MTIHRILVETDHVPPSTNNLFIHNHKTGGRFPAPKYKAWREAAGYDFNGKGHVPGDYKLILWVDPRKVRKGRDLSNFLKPMEDLAVAHGLVDDDSHCVHLAVLYEPGTKAMRMEIIPAEPVSET